MFVWGLRAVSPRLVAQTETQYDELGQIYQTEVDYVDPTSGAVGNALYTNYFHDSRGNVIAETDPNGPATLTTYDDLDRASTVYTVDANSISSYSAASDDDDYLVLSQMQYIYDGDGNTIETIESDRLPNASGDGALGTPSTGVYARVSYDASYYDASDRDIADVDVGTNGGSAWTMPGSPPTPSSTALVTFYSYDAAGNESEVVDPNSNATYTYYDALGRTIETYASNATSGGVAQETTYEYGPAGLAYQTSVVPDGTNQTTGYVYGTSFAAGDGVDSNDILAATENPDPTTGEPSSSYETTTTVDAQGRTLTMTDEDGTTHQYTYDMLGRVTMDQVTHFGSGVDEGVKTIFTGYDAQGNDFIITSYNASGSLVNAITNLYNGFGQLVQQYQAADPAGTPYILSVYYTYTDADSGNNSRLTSIVYPDGYTVNYNYSSGVDDTISRLSSISDFTGTLQSYTYMGVDTVVDLDDNQAGVALNYVNSMSTGDAGDEVVGLDRYGRVVSQNWQETSGDTTTTVAGDAYTYDNDGNVLTKDDLVTSALDQTFTYDGLNQITSFSESGGTVDTHTIASQSQAWTYDALGNMTEVTTDGTSQSLARSMRRTNIHLFRERARLGYDTDGNMTADQNGLHYVYNAWNELVDVYNSSSETSATLWSR